MGLRRVRSPLVGLVVASLIGIGVAPAAALASPTVSLYGAPGSFGSTLSGVSQTPTGESFSTSPVPGWAFLPGEAAYFTTVGADGTVFMANEPQTDNQMQPTATQAAISTFDPASDQFRNVVIPTSSGVTSVAGPWPSTRLAVGGADISDVVPTQVDGSNRIAFLSAEPYAGWNVGQDGVYPTLGYLSQGADGWAYDASDSSTALSIARSATPQTGQTCTQETSADSQPFADCRMPTEMSVLASSHDLVVTQYASNTPSATSGSLMVLDPQGQVLSTYVYPRIVLPDGQVVDVHPREVDADPDSSGGDEHFVVVFDSTTTSGSDATHLGPFAMQEFGFDPTTAAITPLSAPILSGDLAPNGDPLGFETAQYDSSGDLWAAQSDNGTLTGGPITIYRRQPDGSTLARPGCEVAADWGGSGWGTTCRPNAEVSQSASLGIVRSMNLDPGTGAMLIATMSGYLLPVKTADDDQTLTPLPAIDLGLNELADRTTTALDLRKGSIDSTTHMLYLPVQQLQTAADCSNYPCAPQALAQWLYGINLDSIVGPQTTPVSPCPGGTSATTTSDSSTAGTAPSTRGDASIPGATPAHDSGTSTTHAGDARTGSHGPTPAGRLVGVRSPSAHAVVLRLACASGASCHFSSVVTARCLVAAAAATRSRPAPGDVVIVAGRRSPTVAAGRASTVRLPINGAGRRLLGRSKRLRVKVTVTVRTPQGQDRVATATVWIHAARRHRGIRAA
jgi:hypothetical protein